MYEELVPNSHIEFIFSFFGKLEPISVYADKKDMVGHLSSGSG